MSEIVRLALSGLRTTVLAVACAATVACTQTGPEPPPLPDPGPSGSAPQAMQWPDPLPPYAEDVPTLSKGLAIGTWAPDDALGFDKSWLDETDLTEAWAKEKVERRVWRGFSVGGAEVNVDALLNDRTGPAVGYLYSVSGRGLLEPAVEDLPAVLHVRHRGRLQLWFDGKPILDEPAPGTGQQHQTRVPVELRGRYSILLAKCGRGDASLGDSMAVEFRLSHADGTPIEGQSWSAMRIPAMVIDP